MFDPDRPTDPPRPISEDRSRGVPQVQSEPVEDAAEDVPVVSIGRSVGDLTETEIRAGFALPSDSLFSLKKRPASLGPRLLALLASLALHIAVFSLFLVAAPTAETPTEAIEISFVSASEAPVDPQPESAAAPKDEAPRESPPIEPSRTPEPILTPSASPAPAPPISEPTPEPVPSPVTPPELRDLSLHSSRRRESHRRFRRRNFRPSRRRRYLRRRPFPK